MKLLITSYTIHQQVDCAEKGKKKECRSRKIKLKISFVFRKPNTRSLIVISLKILATFFSVYNDTLLLLYKGRKGYLGN